MIPDVDHDIKEADTTTSSSVVLEASDGVTPRGPWWDIIKNQRSPNCPDCHANVHVKWLATDLNPADRNAWGITVLHDVGCPSFKAMEA